ncbi:MAG: sodium:proton antiporter [Marinicaulis sp.]|nr:cation:proton antiporter [Marinicaulis sp.]NNL87956.1 sodium:proton antiporter [Marinicaulis sp.]
MITEPLIIIALCIVFYGAFSSRLSKSVISAPMVFMLAGMATGAAGLGIFDIDIDNKTLEGFGELTLGFILFADAASTNARLLVRESRIPQRLLLVSLPLTVLFGALVAIVIFPNLSWQEAALIAAILAPTDAALGLAVVTSKYVPERIRQSVLVESGFNDGLALPAVLLFAALSFSMHDAGGQGVDYWITFAIKQITIGAAVGAIVGGGLGKAIHYADGKDWIDHSFRNLTCIGVAILTMFCAHVAGGNGFIAAFAGGLVFGSFCTRRAGSLTNFVEEEGQLFSLIIFFIFGAVLLPAASEHFTVFCILYALLSLTVIRMAPTALSLTGLGLKLPSKAFVGWFGPRGLASILFLLIAVEHEEMERLTEIEAIVYVTVFFSVMLHGATAAPLSKFYGRSAAAKVDGAVSET